MADLKERMDGYAKVIGHLLQHGTDEQTMKEFLYVLHSDRELIEHVTSIADPPPAPAPSPEDP